MKEENLTNVTTVVRHFHKSSLNIHSSSIHEGKKLHKCSKCDYSTASNRDFIRHFSNIHEGKKNTNTVFAKKAFQKMSFSRTSKFCS